MTTKRPSPSLPAAGLLLLALLATVPAQARTLRVGPGEELATVAAAAAKVQDGDTVEIAAGEYRGGVAVWTASGITIRGVGGRPHVREFVGGKVVIHDGVHRGFRIVPEPATLALLGLGVLVIIELPLSVVGDLLGLAASPDFVCPRVAVPYPPATFVLGILEHGRGDSGPGQRAGG